MLLTVDDRRNRDSPLSGLPPVPSFHRESVFLDSEYYSQQHRKNETNTSLFRRYLHSHSNAANFGKLLNYQQQSLVRNLDEDWLKNSKNRYMMVKTAYQSPNACRKILVPRISSMIDCIDSVAYAITCGNDKKIRYWDFTSLKKKSYCVNSPHDDEMQYSEEIQGETLVV